MANPVRTGADQLPDYAGRLAGSRIGLLTNPTGINSQFRSTVDLCSQLPGLTLTSLFACEHGIRGEKQAGVKFADETDPYLNIPVYSLYGQYTQPTSQMLQNLDLLVFDIQDLGVRFYTYLSTLIQTMEACAQNGKRMLVLDRPNPLGGRLFEGGLLAAGYESFVGGWRAPCRTGLTIGEFAHWVNDSKGIGCELEVVPLLNWQRSMEYTGTGLPWIVPSPNMPTLDTARVYAGTCLIEGTNLSEARGTTRPFEIVGAPWLQATVLCGRLNDLRLPGVHFHPTTFTPMFSKHQGVLCEGVRLFVTDPETFRPVRTGLHLLHRIINMHGDHFEWLNPGAPKPFIDLLSGSDRVRTTVHSPEGLQLLLADYEADEAAWETEREPYLLY